MTVERSKPTILRVSGKRDELQFRGINSLEWGDGGVEYVAHIRVQTSDFKGVATLMKDAWNNEAGVYLDYPSFDPKYRLRSRVTNFTDMGESIKRNEKRILDLTVVLSEQDLFDYYTTS